MRVHHIVAGLWIVGFCAGLPVSAQEQCTQSATPMTLAQGKGCDDSVGETNPRVGDATGESTLYVDASAPVGGDGSSWAAPFIHLQDALAAASEAGGAIVEIRVAQGAYKPDRGANQASGDRSATFRLINGLTVRGGYAGFGAPDPDEADISTYETALSGDLNGDDGAIGRGSDSDCCIVYNSPGCTDVPCRESVCDVEPYCCDSSWGAYCARFAAEFCCELCSDRNDCDNSYHVVTASDVGATAVLDGFTITAGNANSRTIPNGYGGGMYITDGSPTLTRCTFSGNEALSGGGLQSSGKKNSPSLTDCVFRGNRADVGGGMSSGGAPVLLNCKFIANTAKNGGGLYGWADYKSRLAVNYTDSQDSWWAYGGVGNIGDDPLFVDADGPDNILRTEDDDLRLLPTSPAIDAGDNAAVATSTDLVGNPRIRDGRVDMGAYESGCPDNSACNDRNVCTFDRYDCSTDSCSNTPADYADVVGSDHTCGPDGEVDLLDILAVLDAFQGVFPRACHLANIDMASHAPCVPDGTIDLHDIFAVLDAFSGTGECVCDP